MSHVCPATSSNSVFASHAHSSAPAGRIFWARALRVSDRPSATRSTCPGVHMRTASPVSLLVYFQHTSISLPTSACNSGSGGDGGGGGSGGGGSETPRDSHHRGTARGVPDPGTHSLGGWPGVPLTARPRDTHTVQTRRGQSARRPRRVPPHAHNPRARRVRAEPSPTVVAT